MWNRFNQLMSRSVSGASLGFFRMAFGAVMFYEGLYYLGLTWNNPTSTNYLDAFYTGKHIVWNVYYPGFSWVKPLPEPLMTAACVAFTIAALLVTIGVFYRFAIIAVFLGFSYLNLIDVWTYLNHHYLACIVALLLAFMPADRRFTLWRILARASGVAGKGEVPFWTIFLLRAQMFIVYFYAGVAKINMDWLAGEPVRMWLQQPRTLVKLEPWLPMSILQPLRTLLAQEASAWIVAYGGMIFDLGIGFLLVFRRTRLLGFLLMLGFHTFNNFQFKIGVFPIMAVCLTTIFFEPDWPDRIWRWISFPKFSKPDWKWLIGGALVVPVVGAALGWKTKPTPTTEYRRQRIAPWTTALIACWLVVQCAAPLRHFFIEGYSNWTEEGTMFSWHMMLRTKQLGLCQIEIDDPELPVVQSDAGPITDWRLPADDVPLVPYRQVATGKVPWETLPQFVIVEEPLLGERVIYNPLSPEALRGDPEGLVRQHWRRIYGREPALVHQSHSVAKLLDVHEDYVNQGKAKVAPLVVQAQLEAIAYARLIDNHRRNSSYTELQKRSFNMKLQEAFQTLRKNPAFGPHFSKLFYYKSAPLDGLGEGSRDEQFYVVIDQPLMSSGKGTLPLVNRDEWKGPHSTLIDLWTYTFDELSNLPRCLAFHDLDGRPVLIWNYTHDLHFYQSTFVTMMPTILHRYVHHVADDWEESYGRRPQIFVNNYVKLNHHPMQLIIDPEVDLASAQLTIYRHNPWILKMQTAESSQQEGLSSVTSHDGTGGRDQNGL